MGYGYMMGGNYAGATLFTLLIWALLITDLTLVGFWLWQQVNKRRL